MKERLKKHRKQKKNENMEERKNERREKKKKKEERIEGDSEKGKYGSIESEREGKKMEKN